MEVRTVSASTPFLPEASIGPDKQKALLAAIEQFLAANPAYASLPARIDVVGVRLTSPPEVVVLTDAFR